MNPDSVGDVLVARFNTQMGSLEPTVILTYDNGPPLSTALTPVTSEWVRYAWRPLLDDVAAIGGHLYRGIGFIDVQVFTPLGVGAGASERIQRSIQTIYRGVTLGSGILVRDIRFANVGYTDGWFQSQVRINIMADESV